MVWADLYIGDKSKLNKSPVSVAVYNIVSSKIVIFSLYINIAGLRVPFLYAALQSLTMSSLV